MHAPTLIADRFVANGASWIDLASGDAVRLHVTSAGERETELRWSDSCAEHSRLRHPLLHPLIDYGALDRYRLFEAYAVLPPLPTTPAAGQHLVTHALQFLRSHDVELTAERAEYAVRTASSSATRRARAVGIVLQDRPAIAVMTEVLDAVGPGGPCHITVCGEAGSGLRTARAVLARAARLRGYVPLAPHVIVDRPWLTETLIDRHVCVLVEPSQAASDHDRTANSDQRGAIGERRTTVSTLLSRLGRASTRRHVVFTFERRAAAGWNVIRIGSMGVTAMTSMVFVDAKGPSPAELFEAAREADGRPGVFLERLGAQTFGPHASRSLVAHEAVEPYHVTTGSSASLVPAVTPSRRAVGVLARAVTKGDDLARRGRHLAAIRVLTRASRVLAGRGDVYDAARCAERLARLHFDRGQFAAAIDEYERARLLTTDVAVTRAATLGVAVAWLDDGRLAEAEALLRSMAVAAALEHRSDAAVACALGRCLYWQGRYAEAAVTLQPHIADAADAPCLAVAAAVRLAEGATAAAVQLARRAAGTIDASTPGGVRTLILRTLAAALSAAGDESAAHEHVVAAIVTAKQARLPLAIVRARLIQSDVLARSTASATKARRLAARLMGMARKATLPRLLRFEVQKTMEGILGIPPDSSVSSLEQHAGARWPLRASGEAGSAMTELESMLEVCHAAADEREALDRLCSVTLGRVRAASVVIVAGPDRRAAGRSGRAWDSGTLVVERVLTSAAGVGPFDGAGGHSQMEAAEPVRFAGEVIGAIACRWVAGTPISPDRFVSTLKAAALAAAAPVRALLDRAAPAVNHAWPDLLGNSEGSAAVREATARAARAPYPVLIEGESGSGKELVARGIHRLSVRRDRRFCAVNCAALSDDLLEAELFGHARGAFTGAIGERAGLFEEADGGTLFLDEVGELSPRAQAKLLRVIQEGEIRRVGESFSRKIDVRIVAATNRRLQQEAAAGRFRDDLRFRLDVIRIVVPPLRERLSDIPLLAAHFWDDAARRVGSRATLSPDALAALARYDWPGNVRELQNVIAWMAVHSPRRGRIGASALPAGVAGSLSSADVTFETAREEFERRFIRSALARANGHRASAAESLGISRQGLAKIIRRLRIDDRPFA